jgi:hypothetical protein
MSTARSIRRPDLQRQRWILLAGAAPVLADAVSQHGRRTTRTPVLRIPGGVAQVPAPAPPPQRLKLRRQCAAGNGRIERLQPS